MCVYLTTSECGGGSWHRHFLARYSGVSMSGPACVQEFEYCRRHPNAREEGHWYLKGCKRPVVGYRMSEAAGGLHFASEVRARETTTKYYNYKL